MLFRCDGLVWRILLLILVFPASGFSADSEVEKGRRIYMEGVLPSGAMLKGIRNGDEFSGRQAACQSCHRPSGMGSVEGDITVPPITGNYLYRSGDLTLATMDPRSGKRFNQAHEPYSDAAIGVAIRKGVNVGGQPMSELMPRYDLKDEDLRALIAYLKQLSLNYSPGATKDEIHFATVITPDTDPERRRILLRMLNRGFQQKNGSTVLGTQQGGRRHMVTAAEMVLGTERKWVLHVWDLHGTADSWQGQLEDHYRKEPVFALLSGVTGSTWQPVHDFCENNKIPCWFPSVDLPVDSSSDYYSIYFNKGVMLEAGVLSQYFADEPKQTPRRLVQIYRADPVGLGASEKLSTAMQRSGIPVENRPLTQFDAAALKLLLDDVGEQDAVMLWLDASDLHLLDSIAPPNSTVYLSGRLSGGETAPLTQAWKRKVHIVYPYELPEKRLVSLFYLHQWMRFNQIAVEDEPLQAEVYFALECLTDTLTEMLDNLYRDYLIERAESMLSRTDKNKIESRDRFRQTLRWSRKTPRVRTELNAKAEVGAAMSHGNNNEDALSNSTTIYPRMSLGVSQRFASKGAYIVRFDEVGTNRLVPLSTWIVP